MVKVIDLTSSFLNLQTSKLQASLYAANLFHVNTAGYATIIEKLMPFLRDVPKLDKGVAAVCDMSILDTYAVLTPVVSVITTSPTLAPTVVPMTLPTPAPSGPKLSIRLNPSRPDGTTGRCCSPNFTRQLNPINSIQQPPSSYTTPTESNLSTPIQLNL
jgi:hypothetical protein